MGELVSFVSIDLEILLEICSNYTAVIAIFSFLLFAFQTPWRPVATLFYLTLFQGGLTLKRRKGKELLLELSTGYIWGGGLK